MFRSHHNLIVVGMHQSNGSFVWTHSFVIYQTIKCCALLYTMLILDATICTGTHWNYYQIFCSQLKDISQTWWRLNQTCFEGIALRSFAIDCNFSECISCQSIPCLGQLAEPKECTGQQKESTPKRFEASQMVFICSLMPKICKMATSFSECISQFGKHTTQPVNVVHYCTQYACAQKTDLHAWAPVQTYVPMPQYTNTVSGTLCQLPCIDIALDALNYHIYCVNEHPEPSILQTATILTDSNSNTAFQKSKYKPVKTVTMES